ncbi:2-dehydro-3-deoxyphosphooctonate aldolase [Spirochaetota bacterium]|nr:2-dehydro-3-deoxyphosphooctonate aldolase [Spirochaetota bacterium]
MKIFPKDKFFVIAGPCVIEEGNLLETVAATLKNIATTHDIPIIFKASFDKANRSALKNYRGPGLTKGLAMLKTIKDTFKLPILSDIHTPEMIPEAGEVLDVLQIPAFLARQSDLYIAAAKTPCALNIKKGQFMAAREMQNAIDKFRLSGGSTPVSVCERGTFFGYGDLVVDFRTIDIIKQMNVTYIYDASHSMQKPAGKGTHSGGDKTSLRTLARAQIAAGANGIFIETHPNPPEALSDSATQYPLHELAELLLDLKAFYTFRSKRPQTIPHTRIS